MATHLLNIYYLKKKAYHLLTAQLGNKENNQIRVKTSGETAQNNNLKDERHKDALEKH